MQYPGLFSIYYLLSVEFGHLLMDLSTVVKECQEGSSEAFGILYRTYSLPMSGVILRYVRNNDVAQDILHDGFIVAYASIVKLKDAKKFEPWLTAIMKNLSLQYLRQEAEHVSLPISETMVHEQPEEENERCELTWQQLEQIIRQLPEGYEKVLRLHVLRGMSHKEIANELGISHLTSASQLHRAKARLRRLILRYRMYMGIMLSAISVSMLLYNLITHNHSREAGVPSGIGSPLPENMASADSLAEVYRMISGRPGSWTVAAKPSSHVTVEGHPGHVESIKEAIDTMPDESDVTDSVVAAPTISPGTGLYISEGKWKPADPPSLGRGWTFALACAGAAGHDNTSRYIIPDMSSGKPGDEVEESRKTIHHMPVTAGFEIARSLSPKWSISGGLRYTYLRTDILIENKHGGSEKNYKIHYIGIPVKVNYEIFGKGRFSLYGHAGMALDIPVHGQAAIKEYDYGGSVHRFEKYSLDMPLQWSVEGGLGVRYQVTPSLHIYAEPSFMHHFNPGSGINTTWRDRALELAIPIGIGFTW